MADSSYSKNKSLDDLIAGLDGETCLEKSVTKTVSVRLPVIDLARIDVIAELKEVSRNVLLNDVLDVSVSELMAKLAAKNTKLAEQIEVRAKELAQKYLQEVDHPPHKGPKYHKSKK